jgi:glycosyltransferase involved in cell wall biosynthesis
MSNCSIVICVAEDHRIYRLIESLLCFSNRRYITEIIIVENGTCLFEDVINIDECIKYANVKLKNMAYARNVGIRMASSDYILMTDADVVVDKYWVKEMLSVLQGGMYAAVGGKIAKYRPVTWVQKNAITIVDGQNELNYLPALNLPYVVGANVGFIASILHSVGGYDERLLSGNDVDICYRIGLAGHSIGLAPAALIYHEDRPSLREHFHRFRHYAVYQVLLFSIYRPISGKRWVINTYSLKRFCAGVLAIPKSLLSYIISGNNSAFLRAILQIVESIGVWCGSVQGSLKFRQFYI